MRSAALLFSLTSPAVFACSSPRVDGANGVPAGTAVRSAPDSTVPRVDFYPVGVRPRAIAVADFDGDGQADVAVANAGDGTITVWFGGPDGRLARPATVAAGQEPADVRAVRFDADRAIDLVVANHETSHVTVLLNDGRGHFRAGAGSPIETGARPHVHGVAAADFDDNGWVDVAVESADTREVRVLRGGAQGLTAPIAIAVGTMPYMRLGVGRISPTGQRAILVPGHGDSTLRAVELAGGGLRLAPWTLRLAATPWMVAAGDVTGDGRDDLAVVETDALSLWVAVEGGGFGEAPAVRIPVRGATEVALGDLDGDRSAEVAVGPWDGDDVSLLRQRGRVVQTVRVCDRPVGLAIADLDGNGRGELLASCATTNRLAVVTWAPP